MVTLLSNLQEKPNYLREYWQEIISGRIRVCKKIKKQLKKLIHLLDHPEDNFIVNYKGEKEYFVYNSDYAERPIQFIEQFCKHVKGSKFAGKPIILELWQKAIIAALYGFISVKNKYRRFHRVHLYVARKNGKTLLAACLVIYELVLGGEPGAECYTGATKRDQAKIAWDLAKSIIKSSPVLSKRFRITVNGIYVLPHSDSFFMPISKESKKLDGLNTHISHIDELHAITDSNIIDVMWDSTKSREQPIEIITTTMGIERMATFDEIYEYDANVLEGIFKDDRLLVFCFEIDEIDEWKDIKNAIKANPNLGISLSINGLHEEIEKAKNDPSRLTNLLCKSFNVRQTNKKAWLSFETFNNNQVYDLDQFKDTVVLGGFDLSRTNDLTAFTTLLFDKKNKKIIAETMYWVTQKYVDKTNKVPFKTWIEDGYARISGDELINYHDVSQYVYDNYINRGWKYQFINYDSYSAQYLIEELAGMGYAKEYVLKATQQGFKTLSIPMQELEANLKEKIVIYQNNPVTAWCFSNVELEVDRNGNYMPKKGSYERKIDGVATILNCYVSYCQNKEYFMAEE